MDNNSVLEFNQDSFVQESIVFNICGQKYLLKISTTPLSTLKFVFQKQTNTLKIVKDF